MEGKVARVRLVVASGSRSPGQLVNISISGKVIQRVAGASSQVRLARGIISVAVVGRGCTYLMRGMRGSCL